MANDFQNFAEVTKISPNLVTLAPILPECSLLYWASCFSTVEALHTYTLHLINLTIVSAPVIDTLICLVAIEAHSNYAVNVL